MGKSDKTDKPAEDQVEAETPKVEEIEDAEIIEEISASDETNEDEADAEEPIEIEEPQVEPDLSDAEVTDEAAESGAALDDYVTEDVAELSSEEPAEPEHDNIEEVTPQPEIAETGAAYAPVQAEEPRKSGFVPLVLGGVIAAGLGFGVAFYFGDQLGFGAKSEQALAELRQQIDAQTGEITSLRTSQEEIAGTAGAARDAAAALAPLTATADDLQAQVSALGDRVGAFEQRLTDIEKRPLNEGLSAAAIAAYEREVEDLKELVSAQKAEAAELKDKADLSAKSALARSAVTRIVAALDSGSPYRAAIVDFGSATGRDVPEVLETYADDGVITLAALAETYPDNARAALAKAREDKVDDAEGSKLGNFFKNHLGARSVEPKEGTDTDAILSRVEAAVREGRLSAALEELDSLAEGPKTVMSEWTAVAATRLAATQAAEDLAQSLTTN
ncbi:hypothetical protein [Shimia sp.]|uniref:COG4223 family protein n=1 Tax=Shimia sp. TaxID=1954381 RepID=UPI0032990B97